MLLVKDLKKYDNTLENTTKTMQYLLDKLIYDKVSRHYSIYLKMFNMLTGGNFTKEDFI